MSNVLPFGAKEEKPDLVVPNDGLVGADGKKVATNRSIQNDIIQRRNFVLIDVMTGEICVTTNNTPQAYLAVSAALPQILFNAVHNIAGQTAMQVFKQISEMPVPEENASEKAPE